MSEPSGVRNSNSLTIVRWMWFPRKCLLSSYRQLAGNMQSAGDIIRVRRVSTDVRRHSIRAANAAALARILRRAVATLALGIANTAIFSLFYHVLLRTLPVRDSKRLAALHSDGQACRVEFTVTIRRQSFPILSISASASVAARSRERATAKVVSGNFF